jgi:hypothetical protein
MHIILDLDETLISSVDFGEKIRYENMFKSNIITDPCTNEPEFSFYHRPYLRDFLNWLFRNYKVSVWSAGEKTYVLDIVDAIMPQNPHMILWRDHCNDCEKDTGRLKDIEWLKKKMPDIEEKYMILIDDLRENCEYNKYSFNIKNFDIRDENAYNDNSLLDAKNYVSNILNKSGL